MPFSKMPKSVKSGIGPSKNKQKQWMSTYEKAKSEHGDKSQAAKIAYGAINKESEDSNSLLSHHIKDITEEIKRMISSYKNKNYQDVADAADVIFSSLRDVKEITGQSSSQTNGAIKEMKKMDQIIENWAKEAEVKEGTWETKPDGTIVPVPSPSRPAQNNEDKLIKFIKAVEAGRFRNDPRHAINIFRKLIGQGVTPVKEYSPDSPELDKSNSKDPREKFVKRYRAQGPSKDSENPQRTPRSRKHDIETDQ